MNTALKLPPGVAVFERGWLSSNNILCTGKYGNALIDSGYATHANQTVSLVQEDLASKTLHVLVNTHLHSDHCGGNAGLQHAYPELKTYIPHGLAAQVLAWDPVALGYEPTGQQCPAFGYDEVVRTGDNITLGDWTWQVHSAPGHDPDAIVLFQPDYGVLVSGDALWENGFGVIFPEIEGEAGFEDVAKTLDLIDALQPRIVIPGHGRVFGDVETALALARKRLDGFMKNPNKHALHAGKVLLKFKLLELQRVEYQKLSDWATATHYLQQLHRTHFAHVDIGAWVDELLTALESSGAARTHKGIVYNA